MKRILIWLICVCVCVVVSAQSYHIGDVYIAPDGSRGIVYYLYPDGSGGWVVALNDASEACVWGDDTDVPGLPNQNSSEQLLLNDMAGYNNTQVIRNYQNNNSYAAGVVDFAHGWLLPSPAQLSRLYARLPMISSALISAGGSELATDIYWCSAEYSASNAWSVDFGSTSSYHLYSGQFYNTAKSSSCRVRAVRNFDYSTPEPAVSYLWNTGATTSSITVTPEQTTTYSVTVTASDGRTGMEEHTIVVNSPVTEELSKTVSGSYTWNGSTYYESGEYMQVFTAANGCDSVVTLHLTIMAVPDAIMTVSADTICAGDSVWLQANLVGTSPGASLRVPSIAVGDILCTDGSTVKPSTWPVLGKTAMGIVFYVDSTGEHGWAVHLQDHGSDMQWTPLGQETDISTLTNYTNARDAITDLNGYTNTQRIRAAGNSTTYPAAWTVDFANGWYLPAIGQLGLLFAEIVTINVSLQTVGGTQFPMNSLWGYWSSTEHSQYSAWTVSYSGLVYYYTKDNVNRVRSVRAF
ncbi:MAG: DUF1566 domain-containing protein [Bacteroidales bacterium]|nr:DUF1566 domain-containing protein [Bacteroidales bacterium]